MMFVFLDPCMNECKMTGGGMREECVDQGVSCFIVWIGTKTKVG